MRHRLLVGLVPLLVLWLSLAALAPAPAAERGGSEAVAARADDHEDASDEKLTLERIFPKKRIFGSPPGSTSFSTDGRFGAFLYRPHDERRHGADLYIYDTETGESRRITGVSRMAEYQADAREVREDREKRAKAAGVTLAQLAGEQAARLNGTSVLGEWSGEASQAEGAQRIAPGEAGLTLSVGKKGYIEGEVRIGLVRLPVSEGHIEEGVLRADVEQEEPAVEGDLELSISEGRLEGTLVLEDPAQTLSLALEAEAADEESDGPRGILDVTGERLTLADVVLADDADINEDENGEPKRGDRKPRYGGVQGYEWSPQGHEMLVLSGGDVYRLEIDLESWDAPFEPVHIVPEEDDADEDGDDAEDADGEGEERSSDNAATEEAAGEDGDEGDADESDADDENASDDEQTETPSAEREAIEPAVPYRGDLTRLTRTRERESDVQYLPDGSGYTYLRDGALLRVSFGDHTIMQLDPELKDGERMVGYRISPDRKRLVFLANRGDSFWSSGRQITIVNYRDRFAQARQVTRHMPDDPWPEAYSSVYLYDLAGHETEEGTLERVFTRRLSGPRDILRVPEWSPDSSRIAFAAYDQASGHVKILEAGFKTEEEEAEAEEEAAEEPSDEATEKLDDEEELDEDGDGEQDEQRKESASDESDTEEEEQPDFEIENARVVYQFLHAGGPNTPGMVRPHYLPDSRRMVFITEVSGFRQLHRLEPRYEQLTQLTEGRFEIYPLELSEDHTRLYVTATRDDPNQEHVYSIDLESGEMSRLTTREGVYNSVAVRDDGSMVLATYVDFGSPSELVVVKTGEDPGTTVLSDTQPEEAHKLTAEAPEYFSYENRHGQVIHGHMFKPKDWTPEDERPLLIYVYGGPLGERKMATRGSFAAPSYFFARYMTENHGYVTATIDPRGASGYGAVFEKANFERVGEPQTEDLVDGARWLVEHHGVDEDRMGLHGWSFGGFQTQMVMYTEPDVFAAGIAGAGPTEWYNYNTWYTTGTIGPHKPGEENLKDFSLLPLAKNLTGRLLLVHGMEDSNVLYQDTVNVYRELLKAEKEVNVELFLDPTGGHGLGGDVKTINRYRKYEDFLLRYLGEGSAHESDDADEEASENGEGEDAGDGSAGDEP